MIKQRKAQETTDVRSILQPSILSFLAEIQTIQAEVPPEEWKKTAPWWCSQPWSLPCRCSQGWAMKTVFADTGYGIAPIDP